MKLRSFLIPFIGAFLLTVVLPGCKNAARLERTSMNFNDNWSFSLDIADDASQPGYDDSGWRVLDLPHDWSIEG